MIDGVTRAGLILVAACLSACSRAQPAAVATSTGQPALWGEMKPVVSVKELMRDMLDPASDFIFDSVSTVVTKKGTITTVPKTDADWEKLRIGAITLAEGVYLLKIPRPFAPAGDENNSTGPDAAELSPAEITAKVKADPVEWNARIEALRNVGLEVLDIVKRKDANELWDASDNLDTACEACHRSYWYPHEDAKFYEKLDRRLSEAAKKTPK
ncbi:MAG TPA: hypothetical protein VNZ26_04235 [Vicinamibacterales bacterium]|nr:hypothetical protein [Vicinamibacterales bacterium]